MDADKRSFLFGADTTAAAVQDRRTWNPRLSALRSLGVEGADRLRSRFDEVIAVQIADDDPPEVWATAQRLVGLGLDRSAVMSSLCLTLMSQVQHALDGDDGFDHDGYLVALARLPLPRADEVREVARRLVRAQPGIGSDDLDLAVAAHVGIEPDQEPESSPFDRVFDALINDGTWAMLYPDRLLDVASLAERIVLTHRINEGDRAIGALTVSLDLAGFSHLEGPLRTTTGVELEPVSAVRGHVAWRAPDGWFDDYPVGTLVAVRLQGSEVSIEVIDETDLVDDQDLGPALRAAYDHEVQEVDLPIDVADLVWSLLVDDPDRFSRPHRPLGELLREVGLEAGAGQVVHDPALWDQQRQLDRMHQTFDFLDTTEQRLAAVAALDLFEGRDDAGDPEVVSRAIAGVDDLEVLSAVASILFDDDEDGADSWEVGEVLRSLLAGRLRPSAQARLAWFAALAAERRREVEEALAHLEMAVAADPGFAPAIDRLAWYRSDQGDAVAAQRLWRRLGADFEVDEGGGFDLDLAMVTRFANPAGGAATAEKIGRNSPCWCGSGRKFKTCHLGRSERAPLPDRVPWLCRKAAAYLDRRGGDVRDDVFSLAQLRAGDGGDRALERAFDDPLVVDVALCELGWFERFLAERGPLLPDDEALLAASWALVDRTVYEVESVSVGIGLELRDLRTGDVIEVRERAFTTQAKVHQLVCGRAVPDGAGHQLVGGLFLVAPGTERELMEILDEGDGFELMSYLSMLERPPRLSTREGEPLLSCRAVVDVGDVDAARRLLDDEFEPDDIDDDRWVELHDLDGDGLERVVRATLDLDDRELVVETMSARRLDRVLEVLLDGLPSARVVSDERRPVDLADRGFGLPGPAELPASPEVVQFMDTIRERF